MKINKYQVHIFRPTTPVRTLVKAYEVYAFYMKEAIEIVLTHQGCGGPVTASEEYSEVQLGNIFAAISLN